MLLSGTTSCGVATGAPVELACNIGRPFPPFPGRRAVAMRYAALLLEVEAEAAALIR